MCGPAALSQSFPSTRQGEHVEADLTAAFDANRRHLHQVAYRMLGSFTEAEDAVQETWIRFNGSDTSSIDNMGGWLTTVLSRVCLGPMGS